jgi:integral membrane protein
MWNDPVGRVRGVGLVEGTSALLLFFMAMPLKYLSGMPDVGKAAVFWVGSIHGALFIAYAAVAFWAWGRGHLSNKLLGYAAVASVVPFGPFVLDPKLKAVEDRQPEPPVPPPGHQGEDGSPGW